MNDEPAKCPYCGELLGTYYTHTCEGDTPRSMTNTPTPQTASAETLPQRVRHISDLLPAHGFHSDHSDTLRQAADRIAQLQADLAAALKTLSVTADCLAVWAGNDSSAVIAARKFAATKKESV